MLTGYRTRKNLTLLQAKAIALGIAATTTGITLASAPAHGADLSATGNLANPNAISWLSFIADGSSTVTIQSYSWGGGVNAAGTTILPGGFDLNMTLFDAAGNWYDDRDDIGVGNLDFQFTGILPAGTYQLAIASFGNNSAGFGDISTPFHGTGDFRGRSSAYAVDVFNVSAPATAVPEPSSLVGSLMVGLTLVMCKRKIAASKQPIDPDRSNCHVSEEK